MSKLLYTVVPVEGDTRTRRSTLTVGEYITETEGERRSIDKAHLIMAEHDDVEYVRVYHHHPNRSGPRFLGIVTRGSRRLTRGEQ